MFNAMGRDFIYGSKRLLALTLCLITVWGLSAYGSLPRMEDPPVTQRMGLVMTQLPGASAERVEALVSIPLEEALFEVAEVGQVRSTSVNGGSTVWIELLPEIKADAIQEVWSRVRDRLTDARLALPPEASAPEYRPIEPRAYSYIGALVWEQETPVNYAILNRWADAISTEIRTLPGTEALDWVAKPEEEIQVEADPSRLTAVGLTPPQLAQQIQRSDAKVDAGRLNFESRQLPLNVSSALTSLEQIRQIPICDRNCQQGQSTSLRLGDVATINKGIRTPVTAMAQIDGKPGVMFAVLLDPDQQIEQWSDQLHQVLDQFAPQLPTGVRVATVFEQTRYVSQRLDSLFYSLSLGVLCVFGVTVVMMGWRAALVVGLSLPLSVLMVLGCLHLLAIPLHQMSVMGIVIALGLLIDNAIVVVDEVQQRLQSGMRSSQAIHATLQQLAIPLLASTLTTVLSFLPIALISGDAGEFVRDIAISVILSLGVSFFLSVTVILALMRQFYRLPARKTILNHGFTFYPLTRFYRALLYVLLSRPWLGILLALIIPLMGFWNLNQLAVQFFPPSERDQFHVEMRLPTATPLSVTQAYAEQMRQQLLRHDEIETVQWLLGTDFPAFYYNLPRRGVTEPNFAHALVQLKSHPGTKASTKAGTKNGTKTFDAKARAELIQTAQQELSQNFPAAQVFVRQLEVGPYIPSPISLLIYGPDADVLQELGNQVRTQLSNIPEVTQTRAILAENSPQLTLNLDATRGQRLGLDNTQIAQQLATGLEGYTGGTVLEGATELPIRVMTSPIQNVDQLATFELVGNPVANNQAATSLDAVGELELTARPATLRRINGKRSNGISAFVAAGTLPSEVQKQLNRNLAMSGFELPPGYSLQIEGEQKARQEAIQRLMASARLLAVVMVAILVLSFNSFRSALLIGIVAVASVGIALMLLYVTGYPLGFMPILGTVGLVGVAINDSIVVLSALRGNDWSRTGDRQAMAQVVLKSTRHVLTTTFTTIVGFIPLFLYGGDFWIPLGIVIAGGVGGTTLLALLFIPCAHRILASRQALVWERRPNMVPHPQLVDSGRSDSGRPAYH